MDRIKILDCTLRDGGYINDFYFGERVLKNVIDKLSKASIDIIECGFLKSNCFDKNRSLLSCIMDNAGLMCINLLKKLGVREILLAGFDGFSPNQDENFYRESMKMQVEVEELERRNSMN